MTENATPTRRQFRVVILGAGMAGLSAANHLIKNGFTDFKILEARGRIGGRIVSVDMNSQKVGEHFLLIVTIAVVLVAALTRSWSTICSGKSISHDFIEMY